MKNLNFEQMEKVEGGKLTQQEVDDFLGAGGCVLSLMPRFGISSFFGISSCINWVRTL